MPSPKYHFSRPCFLLQLARVQQELQQAQDRLANSERGRQSAERQVKDLEVKLEELEAQGGKALKNQIKKLEQRVRNLLASRFSLFQILGFQLFFLNCWSRLLSLVTYIFTVS